MKVCTMNCSSGVRDGCDECLDVEHPTDRANRAAQAYAAVFEEKYRSDIINAFLAGAQFAGYNFYGPTQV